MFYKNFTLSKKVFVKTTNNFFPLSLEKKDNSSCPPLALQQLQNLARNDKIYGYQTCLLVESFSENRCLNKCNVLFAESLVEDCLELNFRYVDYQPLLAHRSYSSYVCWRSVRATGAKHFLSVWEEITTPHRVCGRRSTNASCEGLNYTTGSEQYDQVCGRIIGYQLGTPDAFYSSSINTFYVDGISVTHGSPHQHIWTFAGGVDEQTTYSHCCTCPCVNGSNDGSAIPSFVGQNYFCESGLTQWNEVQAVFWPNGDPLWDGQGCGPTSSCCTFNSPPWFNVRLPSPTTNNIEVRICNNEGINNVDTPIQLMELYVK